MVWRLERDKIMKLEELVGFQLVSINNDAIIVKKDEKEYLINFEEDEGECCGFNDLETELLINDNSKPIITSIKGIDKSDDWEEAVEIIFYGENKQLAKINSRSSSGSGWSYGACITVKCKDLNIEEVITSW